MLSKKLCSRLLDGTLTDSRSYLSGNCRGFYITVNSANGRYIIKIGAHSDNDPGNNALRMYVTNLRTSIKQIVSVSVYANSLTVEVKLPNLAKKIPDQVNEAILPILNYLSNGAYVSGCFQCGTNVSAVSCYDVNGEHLYLCDTCVGTVENALQDRRKSIRARKSRLIPGIVGALLGSMVGCVVYFVLWQLGYVAAVAGLVTAVCATKGYELLGGELDRKGVIASFIVMLLAIFFANKLVWSYDAYTAFREYNENITFFDCFRNIDNIIKELELTGEYYKDLMIALGLAVLGSYRNIISLFQTSSGNYKIKKEKN